MELTEKDVERFWSKVAVGGPDECWEWKASRDRDGYGRFGVTEKAQRAHRVAFFIAYGYIDPDLVVMHICDRPNCVNPAHLKLGTQAENNADRDKKGRVAAGEIHYASKLSDADIVKIFELRKLGWTQQRIAAEVGCYQSNISLILNSKRRKGRS